MTNKQAYAGLLTKLTRTTREVVHLREIQCLANPDGPEAAEAISSLLKALERIATHESHVSDSHMECENCKDAYLDDYAACKAIARAALNSDAPLSIGEEQ